MNATIKLAQARGVAEKCSRGSEDGSLDFPKQLGMLAAAGFEGYYCDLRNSSKRYYLPSGESVEVKAFRHDVPVAEGFDAAGVERAVRAVQAGRIDYMTFCDRVMAAGCPGYLVSILGRRVVYFGRTAETHVEHFPAQP
jgi:uncharacterized protein YbcV (DUF1398 family)